MRQLQKVYPDWKCSRCFQIEIHAARERERERERGINRDLHLPNRQKLNVIINRPSSSPERERGWHRDRERNFLIYQINSGYLIFLSSNEYSIVHQEVTWMTKRIFSQTQKKTEEQGCAIMIDRDRSSNDRRLDRSQGSVRRSIVAWSSIDRGRRSWSRNPEERREQEMQNNKQLDIIPYFIH